MKKMVVVFALLLCSATAHAENYNGLPEKFFGFLAQGKPNEGIDYLYGTNEWLGKNSDQTIILKSELSKLGGLVGKYIFHELVSEQKVGTRYAHLIYLVGYERQPVRFELKVYRTSTEWRIHGVSFDTRVADDIEKLANEKILKP